MGGEMSPDLAAAENTEQWNDMINSIPDPATSLLMLIGAGIVACNVRRSEFQNLTMHKVII
jgi:hypothetical protein